MSSSTTNCYKKNLSRFTALMILKKILQTNRNKKEWTKSWFVRNKSSFEIICKEVTVKLYTKDIKNYIRMPESFYFTDFTFHKPLYV